MKAHGIVLDLGFGDEKQVAASRAKLYLQGLLAPSANCRLRGLEPLLSLQSGREQAHISSPSPLPPLCQLSHSLLPTGIGSGDFQPHFTDTAQAWAITCASSHNKGKAQWSFDSRHAHCKAPAPGPPALLPHSTGLPSRAYSLLPFCVSSTVYDMEELFDSYLYT